MTHGITEVRPLQCWLVLHVTLHPGSKLTFNPGAVCVLVWVGALCEQWRCIAPLGSTPSCVWTRVVLTKVPDTWP